MLIFKFDDSTVRMTDKGHGQNPGLVHVNITCGNHLGAITKIYEILTPNSPLAFTGVRANLRVVLGCSFPIHYVSFIKLNYKLQPCA